MKADNRKSFESAHPNHIDTTGAVEYINYNEDTDLRELKTIIRAQMVDGADCFDFYGLANVLEKYHRSRAKREDVKNG